MILKYFKELVNHALNVYSLISFSLVFIIPFIPMSNSNQTTFAVIFGIVAILSASYFTWKDQYEKNKRGDFLIVTEYVTLSSGSINGAGMINDMSKAFFNIDFINNTSEAQVIQKVSKFQLKNGASLFGSNEVKISYREASAPHQEVKIPLKVGANDRRMLQVIFEIPVIETNPENLPEILAGLGSLKIIIGFNVSNQHAEVKEYELVLIASSEDYTKEIVKAWKKHGFPELYENHQKTII